jgi:hypothetical protein
LQGSEAVLAAFIGASQSFSITQALNQRGIRSPRGGQWRASSVMNLLSRTPNTSARAASL